MPPVLAYQTGTNSWQRYDSWPRSCESGCAAGMRTIYLRAGFRLEFEKPGAEGGRLRRVCFRSGETGALQASPGPSDLCAGFHLGTVARGRSAQRRGPPRCLKLYIGSADSTGCDQRSAGRESVCVDQRHRFGFCCEADRRLSRPVSIAAGTWRISADDFGRYPARPVPQGFCAPITGSSQGRWSGIAGICLRRRTSSCRGTVSWCRFNRAGSRSMIAILKPMWKISFLPNPRISGKRRSAFIAPARNRARSSCR